MIHIEKPANLLIARSPFALEQVLFVFDKAAQPMPLLIAQTIRARSISSTR